MRRLEQENRRSGKICDRTTNLYGQGWGRGWLEDAVSRQWVDPACGQAPRSSSTLQSGVREVPDLSLDFRARVDVGLLDGEP